MANLSIISCRPRKVSCNPYQDSLVLYLRAFTALEVILHTVPSLRATTTTAIVETATKVADVMQYGHIALITNISMMVR